MPFGAAFRNYGLSADAVASVFGEASRVGLWTGVVLELVYVPTTLIALRAVKFRALLKYPFCLLVCPVFITLMVVNIAWSTRQLGALLGHAGNASTEMVVIAALPLPTLVCGLWYLSFAGLDRLLPRPDESPKLHKAANVFAALAAAGFVVSVAWALIHRGGEVAVDRASRPEDRSAIEVRILASTAATSTTRVAAQPVSLNPEEMIAFLRAGNFSELDARMSRKQAAYEAASEGEWGLLQALAIFERIDPDLEVAFDAWVAAQPRSYGARAARGVYHYQRAWTFRGTRRVGDMPAASLAAMQELFKRAEGDLLASRELTSRPQASDRYLIPIAMAMGDRAAPKRIYTEALRGDPENYGARRAFLATLRPEWGGSLAAMHAFVEQTVAAAQTGKQRAVASYLQASLLNYLAEHYHGLNAHQRALKLYDAALAKAEDSTALARRAQLLIRLTRLDEGLRDVEHAIQLEPTSAVALESRGVLHELRNEMPQALDDYRRAAGYGSTYAIQRLGIIYLTGGDVRKDYREAAKWLELGARFGEDRAQNYLGWMYAEGLGVSRDGRRALELWYAAASQGNEEARRYLDGVPWYWRARYRIEAAWPN